MRKQPLLVLVNMSVPYFLPMLLQLAATETRCYLESQEKLMCKFSQDANKTHLDFAVYFYSENDVEEILVDCTWIDLQFHCVRQNGFECQTPVSDTVVVSMNNGFADKKGSYRCIPHGDGHDTAPPCRYPTVEGSHSCAVVVRLPFVVSLALQSTIIYFGPHFY